MACLVYSEQDGVHLQEGGSNGEIAHCYSFIHPNASNFIA